MVFLAISLIASAIFLASPANAIEICGVDNESCRPVNAGELFIAVAPFTFFPFMVLWLCSCVFACTSDEDMMGVMRDSCADCLGLSRESNGCCGMGSRRHPPSQPPPSASSENRGAAAPESAAPTTGVRERAASLDRVAPPAPSAGRNPPTDAAAAPSPSSAAAPDSPPASGEKAPPPAARTQTEYDRQMAEALRQSMMEVT